MRRALALAALIALTASTAAVQAEERQRTERVATVLLDDVHPLPDGSGVEPNLRALTKGRASVGGLEPRDLLVPEDERRIDAGALSVETLEQAQTGVARVLVLDTSPTMQEALRAMKDAALR